MDYHHTSTSPTPAPHNKFSSNEASSWFFIGPVQEVKQRTSLMSRLRTGGPPPHPYSRSPSISSVALPETSIRPPSRDWRHSQALSFYERPESAAKSILSRGGRMLRRHGSKLNLSTFFLEEEAENGNLEVSETFQRPQQSQKKARGLGSTSNQFHRFQQCTDKYREALKRSISHPFDFHHVTHTQPRHFERLDQGSQNELINEFVAIRAAQRPKSTLQGIQVDDLCNASQTNLSTADAQCQSPTADGVRSPSLHSTFLVPAQTRPPSPKYIRSVRSSPSIENFSRPAPWSLKPPTSPPPRTSSRKALDCSALPVQSTDDPAVSANAKFNLDLPANVNSALDSTFQPSEPNLVATHAITTVDDSAKLLKKSPLANSSSMISPASVDTSTQAEQQNPSDLATSTDLSLRHACSFPTTRIFSQHGHSYLPNTDQYASVVRPGPVRSKSAGQWEDVVDYSYEHAAEANSNFDWSQKTVYLDGDLEFTEATAAEEHVDETPDSLDSPDDDQPQTPGNLESRPYTDAFRPHHVSNRNNFGSRHTSKQSATELQYTISPFGRHQSSSEFRGYQHLAETSSKPPSNFHIAMDDLCVDHDICTQKGVCNCADLALSTEHPATLDRCTSGESSSFRGLRPLLNKYSSEGSLLSSTTSTIRTYRSSNSVGSLPELIHSLNNSRESVMVERPSPTDAVSSGSRPFPPRGPSTSRTQPQPERFTAERHQVLRLPQVISSGNVASGAPGVSSISPVKLQELPFEAVYKRDRVGMNEATTEPISNRQRSASANTPGQSLSVRGSYSLFPSQQSLNRRA